MKERLITLGLAACALGLFWLLMFPKPATQSGAPHPLSTASNAEGYFGVSRWLAAGGVSTVILHDRFGRLSDTAFSPRPTGNLLIMTVPFAVPPHPEELTELDAWVTQGNTVMLLAALDDTPLWSATETDFVPELQKIAGIQFTVKQQPNSNPFTNAQQKLADIMTPAGRATELRPSGRLGLLEGVRHLATLTALPSEQWQAKAMDTVPVLELARRSDTADPVLWLRGSGDGAYIVSAYASLISNQVIANKDNGRLLSNIVAWSLQPGGRVIFDDAHQGAINEYDAKKFFADPRLHRTLEWLLVLWLAWVLAAQPLRAAEPNRGGIDESAMLRATAGFFAGVLRPVTGAQWLLDEYFDRLRRRHGLMHGVEPPWEWLATQARLRSGALKELRELYSRTQRGDRVSLIRLQRILSQISGQTS